MSGKGFIILDEPEGAAAKPTSGFVILEEPPPPAGSREYSPRMARDVTLPSELPGVEVPGEREAAARGSGSAERAGALARGFGQGVSFGIGDELYGQAFGEQAVAEHRAANEAAQEAYPWLYGAGKIAGGVVGLLPAARTALGAAALGIRGASLPGRIAAATGTGGLDRRRSSDGGSSGRHWRTRAGVFARRWRWERPGLRIATGGPHRRPPLGRARQPRAGHPRNRGSFAGRDHQA